MAVYVIAGIPVEYECRYLLLKNRSEKYKAEDGTRAEFSLEISDEQIKASAEALNVTDYSIIEYLKMGTAFYKKLLSYEGMMLHSSAVAVDGYAYLFSAPSGTGKSTHTELWQSLLGGDRAVIINDDKPAIRKINGRYFAFGTPFSGKHDISVNEGYPIKGICFINQGSENNIRSIDIRTALVPFFEQTIRPEDESLMDLLCERADDVLKNVSFFALDCTMDIDAARLSYNFMKGGNENEDKA